MSIGDEIYALLSGNSALVGLITDGAGGIKPGFAPPETSGSYLTYSQVSGPREHSLQGAQGLAHTRWQFNIWSASATTMDAIAKALRVLLDGYRGTPSSQLIQGAFLVDERETPNSSPQADADRLYGVQQDYTIHAEEPLS
jgi:hypothetical protein